MWDWKNSASGKPRRSPITSCRREFSLAGVTERLLRVVPNLPLRDAGGDLYDRAAIRLTGEAVAKAVRTAEQGGPSSNSSEHILQTFLDETRRLPMRDTTPTGEAARRQLFASAPEEEEDIFGIRYAPSSFQLAGKKNL